LILIKKHSDDQIKDNEMGRACGTYERKKTCIEGFGMENLKERGHLEDPGIDGRIILQWVQVKYDENAWTGLISLQTGTNSRLLLTQ
jgi:hypothetical protein